MMAARNWTGNLLPRGTLDMEWTAPLLGRSSCSILHHRCSNLKAHGCIARSAEVVANMITAELSGREWVVPEWLPRHYLTWLRP